MGLKTSAFSSDMSSHEAIITKFDRLDELLYSALSLVSSVSPNFIYGYLVDIVAEVLAGVTRNRNIFYKPDYMEITCKDDVIKAEHMAFASQCLTFIDALTTKNPDQHVIMCLVKSSSFLRIIIEEAVTNFDSYADAYLKNTSLSASIHSKLVENGASELWVEYSNVVTKMKNTEDFIGIKREFLYGLFHQVKQILKQVAAVKEEIALPYLRTVYSIANKFSKEPEKFEVNYQNGVLGLMYAINCYNQSIGRSFGAYVKKWARQSIIVLIKTDNFVKVPLNVWQTHAWLNKCRKYLPPKWASSEDVPDDVMAKASNLRESQIKNVTEYIRTAKVYSLDHPIEQDDTKITLLDTIEDLNNRSDDLGDTVKYMVEVLTNLERKIVCAHFGLLDLIPEKHTQIETKQLLAETLRQKFARQQMTLND